ncbi:MAG: hypothetical protein AABY22_12865, partial [Nanoarchaeota archaeon]
HAREFIGNFIKKAQEEIARSGVSVGISTIAARSNIEAEKRKALGIDDEKTKILEQTSKRLREQDFILEDFVSKTIFGERPLESIENRIQKGKLTIENFSKQLQGGNIDLPFTQAEKRLGEQLQPLSLPISFLAIPGLIALDFTGYGGGKKQAIELLSKSKDINDIMKIGRQIGIAEDLLLPWAEKMSKISNKKIIERSLDNLNTIQKTSRIAKKSLGITDETPPIGETSISKLELGAKTSDDLLKEIVETRFRDNDVLINNVDKSRPEIDFDGFQIIGLRDRSTNQIVNWHPDKSINPNIPLDIVNKINKFIKEHNKVITKIEIRKPVVEKEIFGTPSPVSFQTIAKIADKYGIKIPPKGIENALIGREGVDIPVKID